MKLKNVPAEYLVKGLRDGLFKISPQGKYDVPLSINASPGAGNAKFIAEISEADKNLGMQLGLIIKNDQKSSGAEK